MIRCTCYHQIHHVTKFMHSYISYSSFVLTNHSLTMVQQIIAIMLTMSPVNFYSMVSFFSNFRSFQIDNSTVGNTLSRYYLILWFDPWLDSYIFFFCFYCLHTNKKKFIKSQKKKFFFTHFPSCSTIFML